MALVQVLLSTYNGAAYLAPLLDSLLAQEYPALEILVRDDGSRDATRALLARYAARDPRLVVVYGAHLGYVHSFFDLLARASPHAAYLALCDQDDVWLPDKVARAVAQLASLPPYRPALYASRLRVVNADLHSLGLSPLPARGLSFRNALVESPVAGCTCVLNQAARRLVLETHPRHACSHDWWIYLVVSAFGEVVFDPLPTILYRQHGANVFGVAQGRLARVRGRLRRFQRAGPREVVLRQATEFALLYGARLGSDCRRVLTRLLRSRRGWRARARYALRPDVYRQSPLENAILGLLLMLRRL
jgi:glycosyltransferase involved in cell wall biosynthesis